MNFESQTHGLMEAFGLTIQLALTTTTLLLVIGIPLALWLNHDRRGKKIWIETLITLPIVLPPTVIGFYLLILFSPHHPIGSIWFQTTGKTLAFSFPGLVIGSVIYSLPFAVQPFQTAFRNVPLDCMEVAETLGASRWQRFWNIELPLARRGIMGGATLSFAHTMGEFGVVLMLGGSIPGATRVASIALYDEVQQLNYPAAHAYAAVLLLGSFALLSLVNWLNRRHLIEDKN